MNKKTHLRKKIFTWIGLAGLATILLAPVSYALTHPTVSNQNPLTQLSRQDSTTTVSTTASTSLSNYVFPNLNQSFSNVNTPILYNLYNISGLSVLYAKTTSNTNAGVIVDSLVAINTTNNQVSWAINETTALNTIKTAWTTTAKDYTATSMTFNQIIYSAASNNFFLNTTVQAAKTTKNETTGASTTSTTHNTVILKITTNGVMSVYFSAANKNATSSDGTQYADQPFGQFVIFTDANNPIFLLIKNTFSNSNKPFIVLQVASERVTRVYNNDLDMADNAALTGDAKGYVTKSFFMNNALILLYRRYNPNNIGAANSSNFYAFSLNGGQLSKPSFTALTGLGASFFTSYLPWDNLGTNLIYQRKDTIGNNFSSSGSLKMVTLKAAINGNNASISLDTIEKQIPYLNQANVTAITRVINANQLPARAGYLVVNQNKVLVVLDENFNYLSQLATVNLIPSGVSILTVHTTGLYYHVYLTNGTILVFDNGGFVSPLTDLVSTNNTIQGTEPIAPVSFKRQNTILNGINYFTLSPENFETQFRSNWTQFINFSTQTNGANPSYRYAFKSESISGQDYSHTITVNVFQNLRPLNVNLSINTGANAVAEAYVGQQTYYLYNNNYQISLKPFNELNPAVQASLPSELANFYNRNSQLAIQNFFNIKNIDLNDLNGNQSNLQLTLIGDNAKGSLTFSITLGAAWNGGIRASVILVTFAYDDNFKNNNIQQDLSYTLNPTILASMPTKYFGMEPQELTIDDVLSGHFIRMSSYLRQRVQRDQIVILPNEIDGTVIITLKFDFSSSSLLALEPKSNAINTTRDTVTWKSLSVFKKNSNLNDAMLLKFNTLTDIQENAPDALDKLPSEMLAKLSAKTSAASKVELVANTWKLIQVSSYVATIISDIEINEIDDLTGSFNLTLTLSRPLTDSLQTTYSYSYLGFKTSTPTDNDIYNVSFLTSLEYQTQFSPPTSSQNLFNLIPSFVRVEDLITRNGTTLSSYNQILGGVILMSANASKAKYEVNLTPNDQSGELLVSFLFKTFIEKTSSGLIQVVQNKRVVHIFDGFRKVDSTNGAVRSDLYYLNWKTIDTLNTYKKVETTLTPTNSPSSGGSDSPGVDTGPITTTSTDDAEAVTPSADPVDNPENPSNDSTLEQTNVAKYETAGKLVGNQTLPSEYVANIAETTDLQKAENFLDLSPFARNLYRNNPDYVKTNLIPNDEFGTLRVEISFYGWNNSTIVTSFNDIYDGFLFSRESYEKLVKTYNPMIIPSEIFSDSQLEDHINPEDLNKFFSFSKNAAGVINSNPNEPNILANLDKKIFFFYNNVTGTGQFIFFVKTPEWPKSASTIPTKNENEAPSTETNNATNQQISIIRFNGEYGTNDNENSQFDTSVMNKIKADLIKEGYEEVSPNIEKITQSGLFKPIIVFADNKVSVRNLVLSVVIPTVILVPLIVFLVLYNQLPRVRYLVSYMYSSLNKRYEQEKRDKKKTEENS